MLKQKIIDSLIEIGAVKFGEFRLKSGLLSPVYIDLRLIISYPQLLKQIASAMGDLVKGIQFKRVAGIPYTALPIATAFSLQGGIPMLYSRKEKKKYGTSQQIEGIWQTGDRILVIDDLITSGESKFETFEIFEKVGLNIQDIVVLIDREQGGKERLIKEGYNLHSLISIFDILNQLKDQHKIDKAEHQKICNFIKKNR